MPARERRAILDQIPRGPLDAPLIDLSGHVVIRTQHVEIAALERVEQKLRDLLGHPGTRWFLLQEALHHPRVGEPRYEQVGCHLAAVHADQLMREAESAPPTRDTAMTLLAADALITYACQAVAELEPKKLAELD